MARPGGSTHHVHIELNKLGAAMKTTFWNKSVSYPVETPALPQQPGGQPPQQPQPATPQPQPQPQPQDHPWNGGAGDGTSWH